MASATGFSSYPQLRYEEFIETMKDSLSQLPRQEAKLAQYILLNQHTLALENGKTLAKRIGVSEVTVGRLLRRLGCNGMRELKELLRQQYSEVVGGPESHRGVHETLEKVMEAELGGVAAIFQQTINTDWQQASAILAQASRVYVTGFQSVRGIAEDFVRRLSLARGDVIYFSPFDNMLAEWTDPNSLVAPSARPDCHKAEPPSHEAPRNEATCNEPPRNEAPHDQAINQGCLLLVDVVPYARESPDLARLAKEQGRRCIVVSDEYCHWGHEVADAVIYAPSRTGLFLESTVGIGLALALLVDAVARAHPEESQERLRQWKAHTKRLKLF